MPQTRNYSHFWLLFFDDEDEIQGTARSAADAQRLAQQLANDHQRRVVCKHYLGYEYYHHAEEGAAWWQDTDVCLTDGEMVPEGVIRFLRRKPVEEVDGEYYPSAK